MAITCDFSEPVNFKDEPPKKDDFWQFKRLQCETETETTTPTTTIPEFLELIQGSDNREFYLNKTFSYGNAIIVALILIFVLEYTVFTIGAILKRR